LVVGAWETSARRVRTGSASRRIVSMAVGIDGA
jgi:hypothetical protein